MLPFRYLLEMRGELFWTEEGYRFSWRVMLMEKSGIATFTVIDNNSKKRAVVSNDEFLTSFQEKQNEPSTRHLRIRKIFRKIL